MLAAAVSGHLFASPSAKSVLAAIRAVAGEAGCLLIVTNYTGKQRSALQHHLFASLFIQADTFLYTTQVVQETVCLVMLSVTTDALDLVQQTNSLFTRVNCLMPSQQGFPKV